MKRLSLWVNARLQRRLMAVFMGVLVLFAASVLVYTTYRSNAIMRTALSTEGQRLVSVQAGAVEGYLAQGRTDILSISLWPEVRRAVNLPPSALNEAQMSRLLITLLNSSAQGYTLICLIDARGQDYLCAQRQDESPAHLLTEKRNHNNADYFVGTLQLISIPGEQPVYLAPALQAQTGQPVMRYALTLRDDRDVTWGVLLLEANLTTLRSLVPADDTMRAYLVDSQGQYLLHPEAARQLNPSLTLDTDLPVSAPAMLRQPRGDIFSPPDNPGALYIFERIRPRGQGALQWTLIYEYSRTDITTAAWVTQAGLLSITALALLSAIAITIWFTGSIVRPLENTILTAERVAAGDMQARVMLTTHDETATLGQAINRMADRLQGNLSEMERQLTALRQSEQRLRIEHEFAQQVLNTMGQGLTVTNAEGCFEYVNPAYARLLGRTPEDIVGRPPHDFTLIDDWPALEEARRQRLLGKASTYETHLRHADGHRVPVLITGVPRDPTNASLGAIAVISDLTDIKRAEAAIRQLNEDLERRVIERTAQLEAANRDLESFTYSVSHDLRAPLRAINGYAALLANDYGDQLKSESQRFLRIIRERAETMGQLLDGLLRLSRLGRQTLHPRWLSLAEVESLAHSIVEQLRLDYPSHQPAITLHITTEVYVDPPLFEQVLVNLLGNAFKFTSQAANPTINLQLERASNQVVGRVCDNGIGFDSIRATTLFSPFQRFHTGPTYEGNGIGLAIVDSIVQRHGGRVWAESQPGAGATFHFALPVPE